jgi:hypothetical protein
MTPRDLQEHVTTHYYLPATQGWVDSFMSRHLRKLCKTENFSQEAQRLEVPRRFLYETVRCINGFVSGLPTKLIFNLDGMGISE